MLTSRVVNPSYEAQPHAQLYYKFYSYAPS